jgi:hypothetical protein
MFASSAPASVTAPDSPPTVGVADVVQVGAGTTSATSTARVEVADVVQVGAGTASATSGVRSGEDDLAAIVGKPPGDADRVKV